MVAAGLILEGGGMRGIYTAGVLDFFIERGLTFPNIYGVSAGACHMCSFASAQKGRAFAVNTDYLQDRRYCSLHSLITTGDLFGAKMCYDTIPNELNLYDHEAFGRYPGKLYAVVTNCRTGQGEYLPIHDMAKDIVAVQASSSLPLLSRMVEIDGIPYLDGGIADSIPLAASLAAGNRKNVVILTQAKGYRKKPNGAMALIRLRYRKYPRLVEALATRHERYNEALSLVESQESIGSAFVIRPALPPDIGRVEKDKEKLRRLYQQGYDDAAARYRDLQVFLAGV